MARSEGGGASPDPAWLSRITRSTSGRGRGPAPEPGQQLGQLAAGVDLLDQVAGGVVEVIAAADLAPLRRSAGLDSTVQEANPLALAAVLAVDDQRMERHADAPGDEVDAAGGLAGGLLGGVGLGADALACASIRLAKPCSPCHSTRSDRAESPEVRRATARVRPPKRASWRKTSAEAARSNAAQLVVERRRPLGAVAEDLVAIAGDQLEEPQDAPAGRLACGFGCDRRLLVVDAARGPLGELPDAPGGPRGE